MCQDVIDTYDEMLETTDWLSEETRQEAKNKLKGITINALYPDKWEDYSIYSVNEDGGSMDREAGLMRRQRNSRT